MTLAERTTTAPPSSTGAAPRLAEGMELIGEYEGSGYKDPHYIARRADGHIVQLSHLLYLVAQAADGERDDAGIAQAVSEKFGRGVSTDNVRVLVEEKLRPLGVLARADGSSTEVTPLDPLLALRFRTGVIPARAVRAIATTFKPLFFPLFVLAVIGGMVALDAWLFTRHGVAQSVRETLYQPLFFLALLGMVVASAAFHETGHATACRYGGAEPGVMGAGIYFAWPAFYTDVTDAYRLGRGGRLRTDLGGVYFNLIFCLATFGAFVLTRFEPLLLVLLFQQFEVIHQMLPFLRMDGYYVISDLTGVPDLFMRIGPILRSFLPGRRDPRVNELKPWVRIAVTLWVLVIVPFLLFNLAVIAISLPRILATAWDSAAKTTHDVGRAFGDGDVLKGVVGALQLVLLSLPILGLVLMFARLGKRIVGGVWRWSAGSVLRRGAALVVTVAAAAFLVLAWWPDQDYRPIQPGERGTLDAALTSLTAVAGDVADPARGFDAEPDTPVARESTAPPESSGDVAPTPGTTPDTDPFASPTPEATAADTSEPTPADTPTDFASPTPTPTFTP
ncbi:MAG: hypothetical protein ABR520_09385 [Mycobacteriales bacterium]|nr:hypothetical protein [Frankia sp.]